MSLATVSTAAAWGARIVPVRVEVDLQPGLPVFSIIGLPDKRIDEAKERVRSAIRNSGFQFPLGRLTVNLSPSDLPKSGTGFDAAIALAILQAAGKASALSPAVWVLGELSLDGSLLGYSQTAAVVIEAKRRKAACLIPETEGAVLKRIGDCRAGTVSSLASLVKTLERPLTFSRSSGETQAPLPSLYDIDRIYGQASAKRVLQIALAGGHNLMLTGPPGVGKSLLAQSAGQLLPPLDRSEGEEVLQIYSIAGYAADWLPLPPFRQVGQGISAAALFGGGASGKPGEISLAHRGILFVDELPFYPTQVKERLREPMQDYQIRMIRHNRICEYPADCLIIAARNGCYCGLSGVEEGACRCSTGERTRYRRLLSQPLRDRFDLFSNVPKTVASEHMGGVGGLSGVELSSSIRSARAMQRKRLSGKCNSRLSTDEIRESCEPKKEAINFLRQASERYYLSGRSLNKLWAIARTIADLEAAGRVELAHLQEALAYREPADGP